MSSAAPSHASRVHGCLQGGALGDSLGYLVEHDDVESIRSRFGAAGLLDLSQAEGPVHFSDITQLTLYTADGLVEALEWANDGVAADSNACLWLAYLRWLASQGESAPAHAPAPQPRWIDRQEVLRHRRHPDRDSLTGLASGDMGTRFRPINPGARGSGPVTRSAPFGLIAHIPAESSYKLSADAAALTHGHTAAAQSAAAFSWLIHELVIGGMPLRVAARSALARAAGTTDPDAGLLAGLERALERAGGPLLEPDELTAALGLGWDAAEAFAVALYAVLAAETISASPLDHFLTAIRIAVNHGGDSAATASLAGNMLGAYYGEECLPQGWLALGEAPDLVRRIGQSLLEVTGFAD